MRPLLKMLSVPGLLTVLAYMSQVGPDDAVSNISKWVAKVTPPPDWVKAPELDTMWTTAFLAFAVLVLLSHFWPVRRTGPRARLRNNARQELRTRETTTDEFVPMPEAGRRAYEQLRASGSIWATAADKFGHDLDETREKGILVYMAGALKNQDIPIYGAHPPSRVRELIDPSEFRRGVFDDGGATFSYHMEREPRYLDIAVRERDLSAVVKKMKEQHRADPSRAELEAEAAFVRGFDPNSSEAKEAALLLLTHLREEGVKIRNEAPNYLFSEDLDSWAETITEWMNAVIDALKPLSIVDSKWFATLDTVPAARVPIPNVRLGSKEDRERFISIFRQHDYRLARLEGLLKKYGVGIT